MNKSLEDKNKQQEEEEEEEEGEPKKEKESDVVNWTKKGIYLGFQLSIFQVLTGIASYVTQTAHVFTVALQ